MNKLEISYYSIQDKRVECPYRIAFLTDLHSRSYGENQELLIEAIRKQKPDAIVIGGDMMIVKPYAPMNMKPLEDVLKAFSGQVPMYYAIGNHEQRMFLKRRKYLGAWEELVRLLRYYEVTLLANKTVKLESGISLSGLNIPRYFYEKRLRFARYMKDGQLWVNRLLPELSCEGYHLLLAHNPGHMKDYWDAGADLVLSGHYHGGVMRLPGNRGLISPQFVPLAPRCWGLYSDKTNPARKGITGAGLGTHSVNLRILNPPQLVIIDWNR